MKGHQMSRKLRNSMCAICVTVLVGMAFSAKIKTDSDKTADFSSYKTYAWGENLDPPRAGAKLIITGAIKDALESRGLQQQQSEYADLIVRYQAAGDSDLNFSLANDPTYAQVGGVPVPGATAWSAGFNVPSSGRYVRKGTLVIDIFDRRQHKLIWSANASDTIHESTGKAIKQINNIVSAMFARYPTRVRE